MRFIIILTIFLVTVIIIGIIIEFVMQQIENIQNQIAYNNNYSICVKGINCENLTEVIQHGISN